MENRLSPFEPNFSDIIFPPVAQLDNAADSDSEERGFESLRAGTAGMHPQAVPAGMHPQAVPAGMHPRAVPAGMHPRAVPSSCILNGSLHRVLYFSVYSIEYIINYKLPNLYYCGNQTSIAILLLYCIISSFLPLCRRGGELLLLGGKSNQKRLRALVSTIPPLSSTEPSHR